MKEKITQVLEKIRPALEMHGGDIELIKIDKKTKSVYIRFFGTCTHCAISEITLKHLVEKEIRRAIPSITNVIATNVNA
jgi:Fe-S cluster biogenesis protein NfuA